MWTTARQEVRRPEVPGWVARARPVAGVPAAWRLWLVLATPVLPADRCPVAAAGGAGRAEPAASEAVLTRGAGTAPLSPAQATTRTPAVPAAAARPAARAGPLSWARRGSRPGERTRAQSLPRAPWRMGSSTKRQDSAATAIVAAVCSAARVRFSVLLAGAVRTMIG